MGVLDLVRGRNDSQHIQEAVVTSEPAEPKDTIEAPAETPPEYTSRKPSLEERNEKEISEHPDQVTTDAQLGIKKAEAAALVWSKKAVYCTYAWVWLCFFMLAFHSAISSTVMNYAFSGFAAAPQISTASILGTIVGGVLKLPVAKTLNLWGRAEGLVFFFCVYLLGMIILAACNGPNGYAAGYVLYWIGYNAVYLILDVFVADTSGLRNRAFAFAFTSTPFICTAFTGPLAGQSFLETSGWRWGYGTFCIVMPFVFLPLALVFKHYEKKAEKMGLYKHVPSGRTTIQSIIHYFHEFDVVGALLLMAAWILLLLPFSLAQNGRTEYKSAAFIAMVVVGFCTLFIFAAWEKWVARVHFIRYDLLKQRTVIGACILAAVMFFSFYCWDLHFFNFVTVVYDLDSAMAGYMLQIYNVGSCFWGVVFGIWIRYVKRFKYTCLFFGLPLVMLGAGLMIHFRGDDGQLGYIIMCQIFIAFGGGTNLIGEDMAVMAASDREGVPMMLSFVGLFSSLGGSIGTAVQAAVYANIFPDAIHRALPADKKDMYMQLYNGGIGAQTKYDMGTPVREAARYAWGQSQKYGCISATAVLALGIPAIAVWKDYRVDKKQNKGVMI